MTTIRFQDIWYSPPVRAVNALKRLRKQIEKGLLNSPWYAINGPRDVDEGERKVWNKWDWWTEMNMPICHKRSGTHRIHLQTPTRIEKKKHIMDNESKQTCWGCEPILCC